VTGRILGEELAGIASYAKEWKEVIPIPTKSAGADRMKKNGVADTHLFLADASHPSTPMACSQTPLIDVFQP
jgi:hypothetical protein